MFKSFKNLKIVQNVKSKLAPKDRWLKFYNQTCQADSYVENLTGIKFDFIKEEEKLEKMVRKQLKSEFPNIENMKSYELLVDTVVHNIKKKQLGE